MTMFERILLTVCSFTLAIFLFKFGSTQVPQATEYTAMLTAGTGGRQISVIAPVPGAKAAIIAGFGVAGYGVYSLWRLLESCGQKFDDIDGCDSGYGVVPAPPLIQRQPVSELASELEPETTSTIAISQVENWHEDAPADSERYSWAKNLLSYPSVVIYGPQGSGKSSFAAWLLEQRLNAGHQVEILDPHREAGQWDGLLVFGEGLDYAAIDSRLLAFSQLIKIRHLQRSKQPGLTLQPVTVLAEEFYRWASKCQHSDAFFKDARTDIRKVSCHVVFVSRARPAGGGKGLATAADTGLLELELEAKTDPLTGFALPAGTGKLKYPGQKDGRRVEIASWMRPLPQPPGEEPQANLTEGQARLAFLYSLQPEIPPHERPLPPHLQALLDFARQRRRVTARDAQQADLKLICKFSEHQIREAFLELARMEQGNVGGEGAALWFEAAG
ncbi:MAG: type IV secretory system conjugative DNA transfer family protein [Oscillatoria princeps RMCB-10]|jgi:hypothetical protein|nr:type IV secretory system conjugative DNA transfer family protein [Oscillatoria princeps RMCB-10]